MNEQHPNLLELIFKSYPIRKGFIRGNASGRQLCLSLRKLAQLAFNEAFSDE